MKKAAEIIKQFGGLEKFKGFKKPNTTPCPDEIFDWFMVDLTPSELKVLLYLVRRIYGFQENRSRGWDKVSLKQLTEGIIKKSGERLDRGTGLSKRAVITATKSLEKRGLIKIERQKKRSGNYEINVYSLRFAEGK